MGFNNLIYFSLCFTDMYVNLNTIMVCFFTYLFKQFSRASSTKRLPVTLSRRYIPRIYSIRDCKGGSTLA